MGPDEAHANGPAQIRPVKHVLTHLGFSLDVEIRDTVLDRLRRELDESPVDTRDALPTFPVRAVECQIRVIKATDRTISVLAPGSGCWTSRFTSVRSGPPQ